MRRKYRARIQTHCLYKAQLAILDLGLYAGLDNLKLESVLVIRYKKKRLHTLHASEES